VSVSARCAALAFAAAVSLAPANARAGEPLDPLSADRDAWRADPPRGDAWSPAAPTPEDGRLLWRERTPREAGEIVDVAPHPIRPDHVAVADRAGRVFVSDDGGLRWRVAREPGSGAGLVGKEQLLLDLDVRWREIRRRGAPGDPVGGDVLDDFADRLSREELLAEHELLPGFLYQDTPGAGAPPLSLGWLGETLVASHGDGWWVADLGDTAPAPQPPARRASAAPAGGPVDVSDGSSALAADGTPWVWSPSGVWRRELAPAAAPATPGYPSLGDLFAAAADRPGLARTQLRGRRGAAAVVPSLVAEAGTGTVDALRWSRLGTVRDVGAETFVGVRAVWSPRRPRAWGGGPTGIDLVVVDGRVHPLTGVDDQVVASYLDRAAVAYVARLQAAVRELYLDRAAWSARQDTPALALRERVEAALSVAEIDALLDAWCDGAVSRRRVASDP
jgi:hypothetical protein